MFNSSKSSLNTIHRLTPPKKGKQELIVQVNIGKKGQSKSIKIYDLHNMSNVQEQIKLFIKANGLKETAFSYIKEIIVKQISQRKQEIYYECHSRCTNNCKCSNKHHRFEEKQKDILDILSSNDFSRKSTSKGMSVVRQPKHLQIKITTPKVDKLANKHQEMSSFVFNSSFTLPSSVGQKQRCFLTDELFENVLETSQNRSSAYFSSMSEFKTKERQQENKIMVNTQRIDIQKDNQNEIAVKPLESSFKKNSIIKMVTPSKATKRQSLDKPKFTCITPLAYKKNKNISTKQRKIALMTPQQTPKTSQTPKSDLIHLNSQSLELMVMEHKKFLKQTNCGSITTNDNSDLIIPVFPQKNVPLVFQSILENLFAKLTTNNPPQIKQINSQYVSYQLLQREQLDFMGILFQKIDHRQLNNLNYLNFRNNSLKHCWKQLQELIKRYSNIS